MVLVSAMVRKPAIWIWRYWVAHTVTVSSVEPMKTTIGRANTTPRMDMSTVAQNVNRSPWRTTRLAFS